MLGRLVTRHFPSAKQAQLFFAQDLNPRVHGAADNHCISFPQAMTALARQVHPPKGVR